MNIKEAFARALKQARKARGLTQEDFSDVSSRTYISTLERGLKSPTIDKLDDLGKIIGLHPISLLTLTYLIKSGEKNPADFLKQISDDIKSVS